MTDRLIDEFIEKWLHFSAQIREKDGLNEAWYAELIGLLEQIKLGLEGGDEVPKKLAEIFVDLWGAMTSSADMYDSDMRRRIYEAADRLSYHARNICAS